MIIVSLTDTSMPKYSSGAGRDRTSIGSVSSYMTVPEESRTSSTAMVATPSDTSTAYDAEEEHKKDVQVLERMEDKIIKLRREQATSATAEDARFIQSKINEMQSFARRAKIQLGFVVDEDMAEYRKHKRLPDSSEEIGADGDFYEDEDAGNNGDENDGKPLSKRGRA